MLACRLAAQCDVLIPVAPLALEVLGWADLRKAPKAAVGGGCPDLGLALRVGKSVLRSSTYQEEVVNQVSHASHAHTHTHTQLYR